MYERKTSGRNELICGSMFSGKSEALIWEIQRARLAKQKVMVFKPAIDNRYKAREVVSHSGKTVDATPITHEAAILEHVTMNYDMVAIDEVQFFSSDLVQVVSQLADYGFRVVLAGLDQDFRGEPFGCVPDLMAISEKVTKLHAVCQRCGRDASRTQRLLDGLPAHYEDPIILVGATEHYEARCRHCHEVPGRPE